MEELAMQYCDFIGQKEPQERKLTFKILGVGMYICHVISFISSLMVVKKTV
jgi:hypothetical protein